MMTTFSFKVQHINIIMNSLYYMHFVRIISMIVYIIQMLIQKSRDSVSVPLPDKMVLYYDLQGSSCVFVFLWDQYDI